MMHRVLRMLAVVILAAVFVPRTNERADRLLIVALDTAAEPLAARVSQARGSSVLHGLLANALTVDLYGWRGGSTPRFWADLLGAATEESDLGLLASSGTRSLWRRLEDAGRTAVLVGLPGTDGDGIGGHVLNVPLGKQFLGGSRGLVVKAEQIAEGELPWPYRDAQARLRRAARTLAPGQWSSWLALRSGRRSGLFKLYRTLAGSYLLSPCYESASGSTAGESPRLFRQPSWPEEFSAPEALFRFAEEVSDRPYRRALAEMKKPWSVFAYFDELPGTITRIARRYRESLAYADATASEARRLEEAELTAYLRFDERLGRLADAAGDGGCVVVIADLRRDRPASERGDASRFFPIARASFSCGSRLKGRARGEAAELAPTLAYLVGLRWPESGASVLAGISHQLGRSLLADNRARTPSADTEPTAPVALTAEALMRFGGTPHGDAEVSTSRPEAH